MTTITDDLVGERLELRYVALSTVVLWEDNPKRHDQGSIHSSILQHGFVDPPKFDAALGALVFGNGRSHVVMDMKLAGEPRPRGVLEHRTTGEWYLPVKFGVDAASREAAMRLAVDHNNLTLLGGDFDACDVARMWDPEGYAQVLTHLAEHGTLPVTVDGDDLDAILAQHEPREEIREELDTSPQLGGMIYSVVVTCNDEDHQTEILDRLRGEGLTCKPLIS